VKSNLFWITLLYKFENNLLLKIWQKSVKRWFSSYWDFEKIREVRRAKQEVWRQYQGSIEIAPLTTQHVKKLLYIEIKNVKKIIIQNKKINMALSKSKISIKSKLHLYLFIMILNNLNWYKSKILPEKIKGKQQAYRVMIDKCLRGKNQPCGWLFYAYSLKPYAHFLWEICYFKVTHWNHVEYTTFDQPFFHGCFRPIKIGWYRICIFR